MKALNYIKEVKGEVGKVVWPTTKETAMAVALVFGMVAIAGVFFLLTDTVLYKIVALILG